MIIEHFCEYVFPKTFSPTTNIPKAFFSKRQIFRIIFGLGEWEKHGEKKTKWPTKNFMIGSSPEWS